MGRKNIIVFGVTFLLIIVATITYIVVKEHKDDGVGNISLNNSEISERNSVNYEILSTVAKDDVVVLPTAKIKIKQSYKKCGHTVIEEFSVPEDIINMTEKEVENYYFGWNIESFSDKEILIYRANNGICEEHYIVKDVDGKVTVFRKDDNNNELLVLATEANTKYLPSEDRNKLELGISIVGKDNLSALLEDYE